jgi:hypothetical protein
VLQFDRLVQPNQEGRQKNRFRIRVDQVPPDIPVGSIDFDAADFYLPSCKKLPLSLLSESYKSTYTLYNFLCRQLYPQFFITNLLHYRKPDVNIAQPIIRHFHQHIFRNRVLRYVQILLPASVSCRSTGHRPSATHVQ